MGKKRNTISIPFVQKCLTAMSVLHRLVILVQDPAHNSLWNMSTGSVSRYRFNSVPVCRRQQCLKNCDILVGWERIWHMWPRKVRAGASLRSCQPPPSVPAPSCSADLLSGHLGLCHPTNYQDPSSPIVPFPSDTFWGRC